MGDGIWAATSGAIAELATLETAANNVANVATTAYKADRTVFKEYLARTSQARKTVRLVSVDATRTDASEGSISPTGRPLDVAIHGRGYFAVKGREGTLYTRHGGIQFAPDGSLVTQTKEPFLDRQGIALRAPVNARTVEIGKDGSVLADGAKIGELAVYAFDDPASLSRQSSQLMRATPAAGPPRAVTADLETQALEQSNFSAVRGMVDIVGATRAFEACEKAINAFRDADSRAAMTLMRVT